MGSHELVDHTADIALHAEALALPELFAEVAAGLFEIICDVRGTERSYAASVRVQADSPANLMHDWLSELLYIHETEDVVLSRFDVNVSGNTLEAGVAGEKIDPKKHVLKAEVKAVTYHMLSVRRENDTWHATVVLDL